MPLTSSVNNIRGREAATVFRLVRLPLCKTFPYVASNETNNNEDGGGKHFRHSAQDYFDSERILDAGIRDIEATDGKSQTTANEGHGDQNGIQQLNWQTISLLASS